jgi:Ca2+-transporting ATPase
MYIRIDRRSQFWFGIFVIGGVMASGTLFVLDASLPGGFVVGSGSMRYAQTMAFTTWMVFQLFNVLNERAGERSAFKGLFTNRWVWAAIGLSVALQVAVIYTPFLQRAFSTASLNFADWLRRTMVASSVLWLCELSKAVTRAVNNPA